MKAKPVKRLDPQAPLRDNAVRIVNLRAAELTALAERAIGEDDDVALHNARIAAKRLRYVLEVTECCFGACGREIAASMRELQDVLGEIHDCDVLLPRVERHARELREADADAVAATAALGGDLEWRTAMRAPGAGAHAGLARFELYLAARRAHLYGQFVVCWERLREQEFAQQLQAAAKN